MTPRVLAIDTATEACSAAVRVGDEVYERYALAPRRHSALILPMVDEVLVEAGLGLRELDGLAFGRGPGSFTGVRIAAGVIQGLALAAGLPVAPVSTLAALAQGAARPDRPGCIVAALDARMGQVYLGVYTTGEGAIVAPLRPETVIDPAAITHALTGNWIGVGGAFQAHGEALRRSLAGHPSAIEPETHPRARDIALIGQDLLRKGLGVAAEEALPVYLRDRVV